MRDFAQGKTCAWSRRLIGPALALAVIAAGAARAGADTVQLQVYGTIEPKCAFVQTPGQSDIGTLQPGAPLKLGTLAFRCNLPDSPAVHLTVQSENGGMKRDGGTEIVPYATEWDVPGGGNLVDAATIQSAVSFTVPAGDIVTGQGGDFKVQVGAGAQVAGTYRDRITYTISP